MHASRRLAAGHEGAAPADAVRPTVIQKRPAGELLDGVDQDDQDETNPEPADGNRQSKRLKTSASDNIELETPDSELHSEEIFGTIVTTPLKKHKPGDRGLLASVKRAKAATAALRRPGATQSHTEGDGVVPIRQKIEYLWLNCPKGTDIC